MLIRLLPEQVNKGWDFIAPMIAVTLPPTLRVSRKALVNVLRAILAEDAQCWVWQDGETLDYDMFIMTTVITDRVAGVRHLLVYSAYALDNLSEEGYLECINTLKTYGEGRGCEELIAYVEDDRYVRRLRAVGGEKISNLVRF